MYEFDPYKDPFKKEGYVIVRQFLPAHDFQELVENLDRYIREVVPTVPAAAAFYQDPDRPETLKQLQFMERDPFFKAYLHHPRWAALAEVLLGEEVVPYDLEWFNKPPKADHPTPPHQDNYYWCLKPPNAITIWLALDRVDEENGGIRYLPGSHVTGLRNHVETEALGFSQGITDYGSDDAAREVLIGLDPGDAVVHHSETVHRADANRSTTRQRRAFAIIFHGKSCRRDEVAFASYQASIDHQHEKMGIK